MPLGSKLDVSGTFPSDAAVALTVGIQTPGLRQCLRKHCAFGRTLHEHIAKEGWDATIDVARDGLVAAGDAIADGAAEAGEFIVDAVDATGDFIMDLF